MERLADHVAILNQGKLLLSESVEKLLGRFRRVSFTSQGEDERLEDIPSNWLLAQQKGRHVSFTETDFKETESLMRSRFGEIKGLKIESLSLKEIYLVIARNLKNRASSAL